MKHNNGKAMEALPIVEKEIRQLAKEYISNVIYTIAGAPFQAWVDERIKMRNEKVT